MKKITLIVMSAIIMLAPSCKKQPDRTWSKHVVTEEFVFTEQPKPAPEDPKKEKEPKKVKTPKTKKEKQPKLCRLYAKHMVKNLLKDKKKINTPIVEAIKVGYYECNNVTARENLYKLQANGLVDVTYSEIKNKYNKSTYWVEVALTKDGEKLIVEKDPFYPEDSIDINYMKGHVSPESGKNKYGEYTFDPNVDSVIIDLIHNFYKAYVVNQKSAIKKYATPDLVQAYDRIATAKELGLNYMSVDPFVRNAAIDKNALEVVVHQWTSYVDLYRVTLGGQEFCIVVKDMNGTKKIDDVALHNPKHLAQKRTMRCTALNISAQKLHNALKKKEARPAPKAKKAVEKPELLFDEYEPTLQPGIEQAEHTEPLPYQIAKQCEHFKVYNLFAGTKKLAKMGKIKDVKSDNLMQVGLDKEKAPLTKKAIVTIETVKVSPVGRIYKKLENGETAKYEVNFIYEEEEWRCEIK